MNTLEKLKLDIFRKRKEIGAFSKKEKLTDEERSQLSTFTDELVTLEERAMAAEIELRNPDPNTQTPEAKEYGDLVTRAALGNIADAAINGDETKGAEAELQKELNLRSNQIPLDMLVDQPEEQRAHTPAPSTVNRSRADILPIVFKDSMSAFLNVAQPRVPVGARDYPYLSAGLGDGTNSASTPAAGGSVSETDGAFTVVSLTPARIQASFFYRRESAAQFAGLDAALRDNLRSGLMDKLDDQVIANLVADGTAQNEGSALATYASGVGSLYRAVDGRYATDVSQLRILAGLDTYRLFGSLFRGTNGDTDLIETISRKTGGIRTNGNFSATSSKKQKSLIRLGSRMDAVAPIWEGITLIPDEVTKAATGEIVLTSVMLYAVDTIRAAGIKVAEYQVAA